MQRHLGTGARDGTGHRGGGGYAHQPRQGTDASRARIELDTATKDRQIVDRVTLIIPR